MSDLFALLRSEYGIDLLLGGEGRVKHLLPKL
jgi:hypothetical protein